MQKCISNLSYLDKSLPFANNDGFKLVIFETLKQFVYVFKQGKIQSQKKNYGNLTYISETFQRCYLNEEKTAFLIFCIYLFIENLIAIIGTKSSLKT